MPVTYFPDSDVADGGWTSTPLWSKLDDNSDADFITSPLTDTSPAARLGFETITDPQSPAGHVIRVRARRTGSSHASARLLVRFVDASTGSVIWDQHAPSITTALTTSFVTYEFDMTNYFGANDLDEFRAHYADLELRLSVQGDSFTNVQADVAWIEVETPDSTVSNDAPGFADLILPRLGHPGPVVVGSKTYLIGWYPTNGEYWLFSATNPSDGYNPTDWTAERLVFAKPADLSAVGYGEHGAFLLYDGVDLHTAVGIKYDDNGDHQFVTCRWDSFAPIDWDRASNENGAAWISGYDDVWSFHKTGKTREHITLTAGDHATFGDTNGSGLREIALDEDGSPDSNLETIDATDGPPISVLGDSNRVHIFFGDGGNGNNLHQRTYRANDSFQTIESTIAGGSRNLKSIGANNGGTVVMPLRVPTSGGVFAYVLTSGDSPTTSEEQITTRDADKAAYEYSVNAVTNGTKLWVLWIDATSDAIYMSERLGADSWDTETEAVTGDTGRIVLSAEIVATDVIGVLAGKATSAEIQYYEIDVSAPEPFDVVKVHSESIEISEDDLKFVEAAPAPTGHTGWGIPIGI